MAKEATYYSALLTSQYQGTTKFKAWLEAVAQLFIDIWGCAEQISDTFDLDTVNDIEGDSYHITLTGTDEAILLTGTDEALELTRASDESAYVNSQLDIIGEIVGLPRLLPFQPSGGVSPIMDNNTYRIAIKAKIAINHWDGLLPSLKNIWADLFPGGTIKIIDNKDMTLTVTVKGAFSSIIQDLLTNGYIVPRSQGVGVTFVFGTMPFLGFDRDDAYVAGFDKGYWT